jgi:lipopolysaccharide export system permease protein
MLRIRNNKDLLMLKVFGFSNIKIFLILGFTSFILGWIILFAINPITSLMSKYYEKTKSNHSRDIDHLVSFTKNGLWIKENFENKQRIISAKKPEGYYLINVEIFHLDQKMNLIEKITSKKVNIQKNEWVLENVKIFRPSEGIFKIENFKDYSIDSNYNYQKINSLFKNFNTISFISLITDYQKLLDNGYNELFLNQSFHIMFSLPFFLFLMTSLAAIFTMNSLQKTNNFRLIILGLLTCVLTFYLKDLSLALGKTGRLPITLAIWSPVIALSLFTFIGILQINEK